MANPHSDATRSGIDDDRLSRVIGRGGAGREAPSKNTPLPSSLGPVKGAEAPLDETQDLPPDFLQQLAADGILPAAQGSAGDDVIEQLRVENADLRRLVAELQQIVEEARQLEESWQQQQREYESLLEEKSEVIRNQHRKLQELLEDQTQQSNRLQGGAPLQEDELMALHDQLERERRQLKEDEETLMQQMKDMELQMSRERAEMARQRNELQRLHIDIQHELELAARNGVLQERLAPLQRRHQDAINRRGAAPGSGSGNYTAAAPPPEDDEPQEPLPPKRASGVFGRLFRK